MKNCIILFFLIFSKPFFCQDKYDFVVAKDGSGDFSTIQGAIDNMQSFPYQKVKIFIKKGVYHEKVKIHEWNTNLSLTGESREETIVVFDDDFKKMALGRNSTFLTSTFMVEANDTALKNLTIENSAGDVGQAIALSVVSTRVFIENCNLVGNQDTLYASGEGRQYYKNCNIEGTTDFIFGNATALFENCNIISKKDSYISAASTPENRNFGFVFKDCNLIAAKHISKVYLGRPWRFYAKTVFLHCSLGNHILPEGWNNWNKPEAEKKSFLAEYRNIGAGSAIFKRVKWSHQLSKKQAAKYTLKNILGENQKKEWYENF